MGSSRAVGTSVIAVALAACGGPKSTPPGMAGPPDSLRVLSFKEVSGRVIGADSAMPKCPVTPHFDAVMTVSHMEGTVQYRWERSTGVNGPTQEVAVPAAAKTGTADVAVKPDSWPSSEKGVQLSLTNRVHILSPVDKLSPPVTLQAKCY